jgi:WD40 repeat protein
VVSKQPLFDLRGNDLPVTSITTSVVLSLAFSSDGSKLASVSGDGTIRTWNATTGQVLSTTQIAGPLKAAALSQDGSKLVYINPSGTSQTTDVPTIGSNLKVQYYPDPTARGATVDAIIPDFNIVNTGSTAVPLSELKIRYYFTRDSAPQTIIFNCDFTELPGGCGSITGQVVTLSTPVTGADSYIEIGFTSGTLAANSQTQDILVDVVKFDMSDFTQTNDYSFDDRDPSFTDWTKVTLYRNGTLVWGTPPS